jgi:uncharacterized membrane protein
MFVNDSKKIKPFPIFVYLGSLMALIFIGILVSTYLSISHYRVYTDINYSSFCAISKAVNCDTVSQSPYSIFWEIPVPVWGVIGYMFLLLTLFFSFDFRLKKITLYPTLCFIGLLFSLISIFLGLISAVKINSYCIMCIITYGINFMLFYMFWLMKRRFETKKWWPALKQDFLVWKSKKSKVFKYYFPLIALILLTKAFLPDYWNFSYDNSRGTILDSGITENGSPWIGAQTPELIITEYSDYMCFQCKKMHFLIRHLVAEYPEKIRLVHKHFPMDQKFNPIVKQPFHSGAGILSSIAIYAAMENKFWELNDYLYRNYSGGNAIYLQQIAKEFDLDLRALKTGIHKPEIRKKLQDDILSGLKMKITGTPSYVIDHQVYTGQLPSDLLDFIKK